MISLINSFKEITRYKRAEEKFKKIVIFTENNNYSFFFKEIVDKLLINNIPLTIISSDNNDIFSKYKNENLNVFIIESFFLLQYFFSNIKCENFIMTTPDLGNGIINKSPFTKNYLYIFHSLISTTVAYKKNAFKNYDSFFCPSKIHKKELEEFFLNEKKKKYFFEIGYPKIKELKNYKPVNIDKKNKILIAPTWGSDSAINKKEIFLLIEKLLEKKYFIIFRPHPMSFEKDKNSIKNIINKYKNHQSFKLSSDKDNLEVFFNCEFLITDWSGSAIEFSLAFQKPSIFLDTDQRIRNKDIKKGDTILDTTFENICRSEIGIILKSKDFGEIDKILIRLNQNLNQFREKIINFENKNLYNTENSLNITVKEIIKFYKE